VDLSPGQRVGYPDWPYHAAWNPGTPDGTFAGGGIPGPTLDVHTAAGVEAAAGIATPDDIPARIKEPMRKAARMGLNSSIPQRAARSDLK